MQQGSAASPAESVFINMPYATAYEERLLALIAGISLYGMVPTAATVAGDDPMRLARIVAALSECRLSIHDLTWVDSDPNELQSPRFNMPFELGIAVGLAKFFKNDYVVVVTPANRLDSAMSDLRALDPQKFNGTPMGIFRLLANKFHRDDFQPTPTQFRRVFARLTTAAAHLRLDYGYESMFEAKPFAELRRLAGKISNEIRLKASSARPESTARPNR